MHKNYNEYCNYLTYVLDDLNIKQITILQNFVLNNEAFALVTFEPFLICYLGNSLFVDLFFPLHYKDCFIYIINDAIINHQNNINKTKLVVKIKKSLNTIFIKSKSLIVTSFGFIKKNNLLAVFGIGGPVFIYNNLIKLNTNPKVITTVTDLAKNVILSGEGLEENAFVKNLCELTNKTAYTVGLYLGSITKHLLQGMAKSYEDYILKVAEELDKFLSKNKPK